MSTQEIRFSIVHLLNEVQDKDILKSFHDLLKNVLRIQEQKIVAFTVEDRPLSEEEYADEILTALDEAANGKRISQEDLKKEFGIV